MKGGSDEKMMEPLFPRLHVKDRGKGGPKPPPRNKMALYEQLSVPSQRSTSTLPHNRNIYGVHLASSSQGGRQEGTLVSPTSIPPPTPVHSSAKKRYYQIGDLLENSLSSDECSSLPNNISSSKNSCRKKLGDVDDFQVPAFVHFGITPCSHKDHLSMDGDISSSINPSHSGDSIPKSTRLNSVVEVYSLLDKHSSQTNTADLASSEHELQSVKLLKESYTRKSASHPALSGRNDEPFECTNVSSDQCHQYKPVNDFGKVCDTDAILYQKPITGLQKNRDCSNGVAVQSLKGVEEGCISSVRSKSCSRTPFGNGHRNSNEAENGREFCEDRPHGFIQTVYVDGNENVSETSLVDSVSDLDISPDDVVGVMGQKHFWQARRLIVNQQRLFSVQVFELHRLIKVQRTIAGSPHLLLEDNFYLSKTSAEKLPSHYVLKSPPQIVKQKDASQKLNQSSAVCPAGNVVRKRPPQIVKQKDESQKINQRSAAYATENAVGKPLVPSDDTMKGIASQYSNHGTYSANQPTAPVSTGSKADPWCDYPPSGNQWLVPVMSPSEGLVYKPIAGPFPPSAGYAAPGYGGYGPINLPPMSGLFNSFYGTPALQPQCLGFYAATHPSAQAYYPPAYIPPYGMQSMSPVNPGPASEEVGPLAGAQLHWQDRSLPMEDVNDRIQSKSPCNMLNEKSSCIDDDELHVNVARSPCNREEQMDAEQVLEGRDVSPLPQTLQIQSSHQQTLVIKVVPHNPRSATESAARIFKFIQEEKRHI